MRGLGPKFLKESFDILVKQTFKDFDVVISDYSITNVIKNVVDQYKDNKLDIKYFRNTDHDQISKMAANTNNVIQKATGKLIKILLLDDFIYHDKALEDIAKNFDLEKDSWLVTACLSSTDGVTFFRPYYPKYNDKTALKKNTISSPSVLTIKNENPLLFDTNIMWYVDLDYYKRCFDKFGEPKIVNEINVVNRLGEHQATNTTATENLREKEWRYIVDKYKIKNAWWLKTSYKLNRCWRFMKGTIKKTLKIKTV